MQGLKKKSEKKVLPHVEDRTLTIRPPRTNILQFVTGSAFISFRPILRSWLYLFILCVFGWILLKDIICLGVKIIH